jgi:hypothetical protein
MEEAHPEIMQKDEEEYPRSPEHKRRRTDQEGGSETKSDNIHRNTAHQVQVQEPIPQRMFVFPRDLGYDDAPFPHDLRAFCAHKVLLSSFTDVRWSIRLPSLHISERRHL